jgi:hypothetical protein
MPELDGVEDRQWQGRRRPQANNFAEFRGRKTATFLELYLNYTQQTWQDNRQKKPGAKSKNGTYPTALPISSLLSTIALSPSPTKTEM